MTKFISFAGYTVAVDKILYVSPVRGVYINGESQWSINIALVEGHSIEEPYYSEQSAHDARTILDATLFGLVSEDEPEVITPDPAATDWTKASAQEVADEINRRYGLNENSKVMFAGLDCDGKAYVDEDGSVRIKDPHYNHPWIIRLSDGTFTDPFLSILS